MPVTFTETFDDGLTREIVLYESDDGTDYDIDIRKGYIDDAVVTLATGSPAPTLPVKCKPRFLHLQSLAPVGGKLVRRDVPCATADIANYFGATAPASVTADGIAFKVMGYTGELRHG